VSGVIIKDQRFPFADSRSVDINDEPDGNEGEFEVVWSDYTLGDPDEQQLIKVESTLDDLDFGSVFLYVDPGVPVISPPVSPPGTTAFASGAPVSGTTSGAAASAPPFSLASPVADAAERFIVSRHFLVIVDHHETIRAKATAYPLDGEVSQGGNFVRQGIIVSNDPIRETEYRRTAFAFSMARGATHLRLVVKKEGNDTVRGVWSFRLEE
jgi:hypothetical protein